MTRSWAKGSASLSLYLLDGRNWVLGVRFEDYGWWDKELGCRLTFGLGPIVRVDFHWGMKQ